jgi:hypothetical protein
VKKIETLNTKNTKTQNKMLNQTQSEKISLLLSQIFNGNDDEEKIFNWFNKHAQYLNDKTLKTFTDCSKIRMIDFYIGIFKFSFDTIQNEKNEGLKETIKTSLFTFFEKLDKQDNEGDSDNEDNEGDSDNEDNEDNHQKFVDFNEFLAIQRASDLRCFLDLD